MIGISKQEICKQSNFKKIKKLWRLIEIFSNFAIGYKVEGFVMLNIYLILKSQTIKTERNK